MSRGRVQDKVTVVTGAGSGIGRAAATLLAREGAVVVLADINEGAARAAAAEVASGGGRAEAAALDVADEAAWGELTGRVLAAHGRLDVVVNNAGVLFGKPVAEMSLAEWRRVLAVNLDGVFLGTRHGIRAMRAGAAASSTSLPSPGSSRSPGRRPTGRARPPSACSRKSPPSSARTPGTACGSTW
jgi:NAD(P)-dependent dehydrogenase (short-subunit alcohol dehydrogenase family)